MFRSLIRATRDAARQAVAWNIEDLKPPRELTLFNFANEADLKNWKVYSDSEHGGLSTANLDLNGDGSPTATFSGVLSEDLSETGFGKMVRSGFSGMRTVQAAGRFNLDAFDTIALRVKGDGRCYVSTIRTESWWGTFEESNIWQSMLYAPKDEWFVAKIPLDRYLPTMKGKVIEIKNDMNRARICGMALALSANGGPEGAVVGEGDFKLELEWIKALRCSDQ